MSTLWDRCSTARDWTNPETCSRCRNPGGTSRRRESRSHSRRPAFLGARPCPGTRSGRAGPALTARARAWFVLRGDEAEPVDGDVGDELCSPHFCVATCAASRSIPATIRRGTGYLTTLAVTPAGIRPGAYAMPENDRAWP